MSRSLVCLSLAVFGTFLQATAALKSADNSWYYDNWCGGNLEFLDDGKCVKLFPEHIDREWSCGVPTTTVPSEADGYQADTLLANVAIDTTTLNSVVNDTDVNLCIILTKRVADASAPSGVRLYNKYMCAGDYSATTAYETWSSSKVFAMANAAGHLRTNESHCGSGDAHNHLFGLDGSVTGKHGITKLGDLSTIICSYDETAGYSSNSLSSYFHDIGWRDRINGLVQNWLLALPQNTSEEVSAERNTLTKVKLSHGVASDLPQTLGGNYGEATPSDLTLQVTAGSTAGVRVKHCGKSGLPAASAGRRERAAKSSADHTTTSSPTATTDTEVCGADKDPWPVIYSNSLSALSAAELVRRIALHRELPQELQFPGAGWTDLQHILYGAEESVFFPGQVWGGMTADTAIFTQAGLDLPSLLQQWDAEGHSQWRIFSKLGAGYSTSRDRGEIVSNAYSCLPKYGSDGAVVGGIEFTIGARGSVPYDSSLQKVQQKLHDAMDKALQYALANYAV